MRIHWIFLMHLQLLWLHNAYHFNVLLHQLPFGRNLKTDFLRSTILGAIVVLAGWNFSPIESPPMTSQYISIQRFALSAAVWPQFQCQVMNSQFDPHLGGRMDLGGRKWYQSKCHSHITIRLLNTLFAYLAPLGHNAIYNATYRQTENGNRPHMLPSVA